MRVLVANNGLERAMRALKRQMIAEKMPETLKGNQFFKSKGQKQHEKRHSAVKKKEAIRRLNNSRNTIKRDLFINEEDLQNQNSVEI